MDRRPRSLRGAEQLDRFFAVDLTGVAEGGSLTAAPGTPTGPAPALAGPNASFWVLSGPFGTREIWVDPDLPRSAEDFALRTAVRFSAADASVVARVIDVFSKLPGYPIQVVGREGVGKRQVVTVNTLTRIETVDVDAEKLQIPPDYRRLDGFMEWVMSTRAATEPEPAPAADPPAPMVSAARPRRVAGWSPIAAASRTGSVFGATNDTIWRCTGSECVGVGLAGATGARVPLACGQSYDSLLTFSRSGRFVVYLCRDKVVVTDLERSTNAEHFVGDGVEVYGTAVDDNGSPTWVAGFRGGYSANRAQSMTPLDYRGEVAPMPGVGDVLAYTTENGKPGEAIWFAGGVRYPLKGLAFTNAGRIWVSESTGGYVEVAANGAATPVSGAPKGGWPPDGVLLDNGPFGAAGTMWVYERRVAWTGPDLEFIGSAPLPEEYAHVLATPDGTTLVSVGNSGWIWTRPVHWLRGSRSTRVRPTPALQSWPYATIAHRDHRVEPCHPCGPFKPAPW